MSLTKIRKSLCDQPMLLKLGNKVLIGKLLKLGPIKASFRIPGYKRNRHLRSEVPLEEKFKAVQLWIPSEMVEELGLENQVVEGAWEDYEESIFEPQVEMLMSEDSNVEESQ